MSMWQNLRLKRKGRIFDFALAGATLNFKQSFSLSASNRTKRTSLSQEREQCIVMYRALPVDVIHVNEIWRRTSLQNDLSRIEHTCWTSGNHSECIDILETETLFHLLPDVGLYFSIRHAYHQTGPRTTKTRIVQHLTEFAFSGFEHESHLPASWRGLGWSG